ncbi:hypothetical protein GCM10010329_02990 [Streptomyces spiroverticillatus]|uniref:Uncharacterized protein n=1 Tax=Streptomyces finlayi TaxID=67296 RepID=A0A918WSJ8_9ACTN|nr:hypothetical protein [Streptomyces finlayi]GGZ86543.1 hypothetical protein GCM10010329_02990 [Streptomyces spiroverticillatus]GHC78061.1 hypothetical protein GCM10010334_02970 [Streptomyces finlayi]
MGGTGTDCHFVQRIGRAGCRTGTGAAGFVCTLATWTAQVTAWMFATLSAVGLSWG